ncbi:DUF4148 domain-containing protein [Roseateles sp. BYS78W]|uniref:DUF4148 domain-containing protein n=1 Tax=Pelomonas candidula TaxID=3299025 RepID=A0ABW7HKF6_9BURK
MLKQSIAAAVLAVIATSVLAQGDARFTRPAAPEVAATRAEVLADLEIYRQSGLEHYDRLESPDFGSPVYRAAQKRYQDLRNSPRYAALVRANADRLGERVQLAGQAAPSGSGGQ